MEQSILSIAYDPIYKLTLPEGHRFPMEKYELLPAQLLYEGTCSENDFFEPQTAAKETVLRIHESDYVNRLEKMQLTHQEIRKIGFPLSKELIKREFIIAGGTIMGCEKAMINGIAMNIAGGTHHAYGNRGEAFCLLNDQAIAAQYLLDKKLAEKILIIDLDVHQGNGTAAIFKEQTDVFTFSMHGAKNYPFKKEKSDLDIALEDKTADLPYLEILKKKLPELLQKIQPDFIFYLCGVDVLLTDKLGRLGLSIAGCKERDHYVLSTCKEQGIPVQCSMGGGYSKDIKIIIEAHANTFRVAKSIFD